MSWVLGYADEITVRPGANLTFRVSGAGSDTVAAQLVRLRHGDTHPDGPGFREVELNSAVNGTYPLVDQPSHFGSYGRIPGARAVLGEESSFTLFAFVQPMADTGLQPVLSAWDEASGAGIALVLEQGLRPGLRLGGPAGPVAVTASDSLTAGVWYALSGSWDAAARRAQVHATPIVNSYNSRYGRVVSLPSVSVAGQVDTSPTVPAVDLLLGALDATDERVVRGTYNGKIALPCVFGGVLGRESLTQLADSGTEPRVTEGLRAWWDLTDGIDTTALAPRGPHAAAGVLLNLPTRAVTAHNWDGSSYNWKHAPHLYGAVHFHADDVDDTGWAATCSLVVPDDLPSGVYGLRLRAGDCEDHVPFVVSAAPGQEKRLALLLPTASYMAYGNESIATGSDIGQSIAGHTPTLQPLGVFQLEHPEFGRSSYDLHTDGSGVSLVSRRRPILNMRPRHRFAFLGTWQFPSDLYLVDWLDEKGYAYDVLTDEDLHRRGAEALRPYDAVITGTHPEYTSEQMLDGIEDYVCGGGHVMYMGGNGFYWVVSYHPEKPYVLEVRKGESGSRAWQGAPGELLHSTTGEKGGLWRARGRAPQKVFGTGFASEGFNGSSYYRRMPDATDPAVAWVLDGVAEGRIGDFGLVGGGASGQEIDRADLRLGTPPGTYLLASSEGHDDSYLLVVEDVGFMFPGLGGTENRDVRADLTLYETATGGAVFSTSSIAWAGSLSHDGYENNISRITSNVLDRFLQDGHQGRNP